MGPSVSRNCARPCQLSESHTLHLCPHFPQQKLPNGPDGGWIFQAMPAVGAGGLPCAWSRDSHGAGFGSAQSQGEASACHASCFGAWSVLLSAYEASLFDFLI